MAGCREDEGQRNAFNEPGNKRGKDQKNEGMMSGIHLSTDHGEGIRADVIVLGSGLTELAVSARICGRPRAMAPVSAQTPILGSIILTSLLSCCPVLTMAFVKLDSHKSSPYVGT